MKRADPRQFDFFAAIAPTRAPAAPRRIDPDGEVVRGDIMETLILPHPRMAWDYARIELHPHTDGRWMWSTSWSDEQGGGSYRVGPKWGNFAQTRDDALFYACAEMRDRMRAGGKVGQMILRWLDGLAA